MGRLRAGDIVCRGVCCAAVVRHLGGVSPQTSERMNTWVSTKRQDPRSKIQSRPVGATSGLAGALEAYNSGPSNLSRWNLDLGSSLDLGSWILDLRRQ